MIRDFTGCYTTLERTLTPAAAHMCAKGHSYSYNALLGVNETTSKELSVLQDISFLVWLPYTHSSSNLPLSPPSCHLAFAAHVTPFSLCVNLHFYTSACIFSFCQFPSFSTTSAYPPFTTFPISLPLLSYSPAVKDTMRLIFASLEYLIKVNHHLASFSSLLFSMLYLSSDCSPMLPPSGGDLYGSRPERGGKRCSGDVFHCYKSLFSAFLGCCL